MNLDRTTRCIMSRRQNAVDVPFEQPNWLGAIIIPDIVNHSHDHKVL